MFEIPTNPPRRIRFTDRIGHTIHKASLRISVLTPGYLVWVQSQRVQYLDVEDATALRDFLTKWLREQRKASKS